MADKPLDKWTRLRSVGEGDGTIEISSLSSDIDTGFGLVRFAIGPEGQPRLMVPCGVGSSLKNNVSSSKLVTAIGRYVLSGRSTLFVDLMCADRRLDPVFAELAEEIVHRVEDGQGPIDAVEGTIADFRDLLRDKEAQDIADSQVLGLMGELVVLRLLVRISSQAIEAWTGPYDQRHDFRRLVHAIEVKTSSRADATSISVSSCDQLAEPAGGTLMLAHVKVERTDRGDLSIAQLALDIISSGVPRQLLEERLAASGCLDLESPAWNRLQYSLEGLSGYRVAMGFPRITSAQFPGGMLPEGVEHLTYVVDLRAAHQFLLPERDLIAALERIAR